MARQFEQVLTAPIKSIDTDIRVRESDGWEFQVARLEDQVKGKILEVGGAVAISAETVAKYGEQLIGKKVKRWVLISEDE
jgi:hypothetical protein